MLRIDWGTAVKQQATEVGRRAGVGLRLGDGGIGRLLSQWLLGPE